VTRRGRDAQTVLQQAVSEGYRGIPTEVLIAGTIDEAPGMVPWHFRAAWLRLKQTDLISGKGQFR
jgi:hypothetical protein